MKPHLFSSKLFFLIKEEKPKIKAFHLFISFFLYSEIKSMPVAIANFTVKFTFNISYITPQIISIIIKKYIPSMWGGEQGGMKSKILDTCPQQ